MVDNSVFIEEAGELLIELESVLLELGKNPDDPVLVQRAFRALHTIKGSGGMFGFDAISRFTHEIETVFELVRDNRLPVSAELIDLTLQGRDLIKAMLEETAVGTADLQQLSAVVERFRQMAETKELPQPEPNVLRAAVELESVEADQSSPRKWSIHFRPADNILVRGTQVQFMFRELAGMGKLEITANTDAVPELTEIEPEKCYLSWHSELTTTQALNAIRDVFIFVEDVSDLRIEAATGTTAGTTTASAAENTVKERPPAPLRKRDNSRPTEAAAKVSANKASIRVAADKLDGLLNFVGELVTVQARLSDLALRSNNPETVLIAEEVERLSAGLRDSAMSIRMLPLKGTFDRFQRLIHDLTRDLGKEIEFTTEGSETELDKTVIDQLSDPLLHLIRNSADHGIESPEERAAAGKPRAGTIRLSALYSGANVLIRISDDGRGLNAEAIRTRAIDKGLISPDARLSQSDLLSLILMPGFSTAKKVTDVSGRGVGMDVVRRNVEMLRGSIELTSTPGVGTTVTLRLPLTLAIIDGLLVRVEDAHFVVPLANVTECIELTRDDVERMHGQHLVNVRGELVPYIPLREYFQIAGSKPDIEQIIIVETREGRFGFALDEVLGDHQTVIKNLGRIYRDVQVISGATILGDGSIALILDPHRLVQDVARIAGAQTGGMAETPPNDAL